MSFFKKKVPKPKTYKEWNDEGYQVIKGMKSEARNEDGIATFTIDQVKVKPVRIYIDEDDMDPFDPYDTYTDPFHDCECF
jgi:hypothetical protein